MAGDLLFAHHAGQPGGDALGHLPGVDEHQRGAVFFDQLGDPLVNLIPLLVRTNGLQRRRGDFDGDIHLPAMAHVHQRALPANADQEFGDFRQRLLRGREADTLEWAGEGFEAFEGQRQMRATLVAGEGVDFIDDRRFDVF